MKKFPVLIFSALLLLPASAWAQAGGAGALPGIVFDAAFVFGLLGPVIVFCAAPKNQAVRTGAVLGWFAGMDTGMKVTNAVFGTVTRLHDLYFMWGFFLLYPMAVGAMFLLITQLVLGDKLPKGWRDLRAAAALLVLPALEWVCYYLANGPQVR